MASTQAQFGGGKATVTGWHGGDDGGYVMVEFHPFSDDDPDSDLIWLSKQEAIAIYHGLGAVLRERGAV